MRRVVHGRDRRRDAAIAVASADDERKAAVVVQRSQKDPVTNQHFTTLAPGQELGRDVDLNEYDRLPRGTYQVVAVYAPQASPVAPDAWTGEARSAPVTIEVR